MRILALDPGPEQTAYVRLDAETGLPLGHGIVPNDDLVGKLEQIGPDYELAIEMIASYGMPVGRDVFETCVWIGQFIHAVRGVRLRRHFRKEIKLYLCGSPRAKDSNVRQALIDRFGPGKDAAIGKKATPGPLYGIRKDEWAALAVAVYHLDREVRSAV